MKKFFGISILSNIFLSIGTSFFYSKLWWVLINILVVISFLGIYLLVFRGVKRKKYIFVPIFFWYLTNFLVSSVGYSLIEYKSRFSGPARKEERKIDACSSYFVITQSQRVVLSGQLKSLSDGGVVPFARVVLYDSEKKLLLSQTYSDPDGKFSIILEVPTTNNNYSLSILHKDFQDYNIKCQLLRGILYEQEIFLTKKKKVK